MQLHSRAVTDIVIQFSDRVRMIARWHRLGADDVEDVMQNTWIRLLERGDGIRDPQAVGAWLETTARRESLRLLRSAARELPTSQERMAEELTDPVDEQRLADAERREAVAAALAGLSGRQREVITLMLAEPEPSYAEISERLGMPIGSIGPTRARTIERLRASRHVTAVIAGPDPSRLRAGAR